MDFKDHFPLICFYPNIPELYGIGEFVNDANRLYESV